MTLKHISLLLGILLTVAMPVKAQTTRQWRDSLAVLNRLIEQQPCSTDLRLKKAAVNIELEQWEYAIEEYGNVLRLDSKNLAALYYRAYANTHLRQYNLARSDYEEFLRISPLHMEARMGLAYVNEQMGRRTDAMDQFNLLVEMFPDSAACYAARAAFETKQEQYELALYDWDEAVRRQPSNIEYIATREELKRKMKKEK